MNTLSKIQRLTDADAPVGQDWEPYFKMFEDLPTLVEADWMDRTWVMDSSSDILIGGNETPLYTISSERRTKIRTLCQKRSFITRGIAQWLRYYLSNLVEYRPQEETREYAMEAEALHTRAMMVMCTGLCEHVEWFSTNFREPRIVWLIWMYLDLLNAFDELFCNRRTSILGKPFSTGKAKAYELLRKDAREEEELKNDQGETDYSHLASFLRSDPVTIFSEFKSLTELEALTETISKACTETARLNLYFASNYWIPFTKARSRYHNFFRKNEWCQMIRM